MKKNPRKILIIRFSSIGDIVLTTPVVRCLKKQLGAEIHYLTKKVYLPLVEANPHISRVFTIEKKVSEVLPQLKKEHYDCIIDLHKNLRSLRVRISLGVKSFSFDKLNFEKWLLVNFKINRLPPLHLVDRYMQAAAPLGVVNDGEGLDYFFPAGFSQSPITSLPLRGHQSPYIAFATGAAHQTKRLPTEKILAICRGIEAPVVLLGGKEEMEEGDRIVKEAGSHVLNLCGKLTLHESAAVLKNAAKVITHDTGMMHISAAFQKEILSVWGNTVPAFGMYPYYKNGVEGNTSFEVKGLRCRPCSKIGFGECPKGHFCCMKNIDVEKIIAAISPAEND